MGFSARIESKYDSALVTESTGNIPTIGELVYNNFPRFSKKWDSSKA